jgi:hypothetical protein
MATAVAGSTVPALTVTWVEGLLMLISTVSPFAAPAPTSSTAYTTIAAVVLIPTEPVKLEVPFAALNPSVSVEPNCDSVPAKLSLAPS